MEGNVQNSNMVQKRVRFAKRIQWAVGIVWSCVFAVDFNRFLFNGHNTCLPSFAIAFWILLGAVLLMRLLTTTWTTVAVLLTSIFLMLPLYGLVGVLDVDQSICSYKCEQGDEVACVSYFLIAPEEKRNAIMEKSCGRKYMTGCSLWMDELEKAGSVSGPCDRIKALCNPKVWYCFNLYERCCNLGYPETCASTPEECDQMMTLCNKRLYDCSVANKECHERCRVPNHKKPNVSDLEDASPR